MTSFDYIVVGAGSAGAVVAARLSEAADNSVLLIEARGRHKHMNVQVPAAFSKQFKSDLDWAYFSEPEQYLGGRRIFMPRAKMLGGCSSMNAMIYIAATRPTTTPGPRTEPPDGRMRTCSGCSASRQPGGTSRSSPDPGRSDPDWPGPGCDRMVMTAPGTAERTARQDRGLRGATPRGRC